MCSDSPVITPIELFFQGDGSFPNSVLPLLIYRDVKLGQPPHPAVGFERRFSENDWTNSWRNQIYSFTHYHSTTHEVLAVFQGTATIEVGGPTNGTTLNVSPGDILVIPAGVAHRQVNCSGEFAVVGAYPEGRDWDVLKGEQGERQEAEQRIAALALPAADPVFGKSGPLVEIWKLYADSNSSQ